MEKETELQNAFKDLEKKLSTLNERLVQTQVNNELSKYLNSYLTDLLRSRDMELKNARDRIRKLTGQVESLSEEIEQVKQSRSSLASDLQRLMRKREKIQQVKESVSALRESARVVMEQLGPDPRSVVFVKASKFKKWIVCMYHCIVISLPYHFRLTNN